jgi:hypothetical protein
MKRRMWGEGLMHNYINGEGDICVMNGSNMVGNELFRAA